MASESVPFPLESGGEGGFGLCQVGRAVGIGLNLEVPCRRCTAALSSQVPAWNLSRVSKGRKEPTPETLTESSTHQQQSNCDPFIRQGAGRSGAGVCPRRGAETWPKNRPGELSVFVPDRAGSETSPLSLQKLTWLTCQGARARNILRDPEQSSGEAGFGST